MKDVFKELWFWVFPPLTIRIAETRNKIADLENFIDDSDNFNIDDRALLEKLKEKLRLLESKQRRENRLI